MSVTVELVIVALFAALGVTAFCLTSRQNPAGDCRESRRLHWHLFFLLPILVALPIFSIWMTANPSFAWEMPAWLQNHIFAAYWGAICSLLAYGFAFACSSKFRGKDTGRWAVLGVAILVVSAIQVFGWWKTHADRLTVPEAPRIARDGVILQSTPASCVPASAANVAKILGVNTSEAEMARFCDAHTDGTYPAQALAGLQRIGISGRKVSEPNHDIRAIKPPAILFFLDDTHAVVYVSLSNGLAEIWNPSVGKTWLAPERLASLWTGHALEFWRE